jgi:hypothetical protein
VALPEGMSFKESIMDDNTSRRGEHREMTSDELDLVTGGGVASVITEVAKQTCLVTGAVFLGLAKFVSGK